MAFIDDTRERWERMNSSEQRLLSILAIAIVVMLIMFFVGKIETAMAEIAARNDESRVALRKLAVYRNAKAKQKAAGTEVRIPAKGLELDSYLDGIISEMELGDINYPKPKENTIGPYLERVMDIKLRGLNINQMTEFLKNVESKSKLVVVKDLTVKTNFREKEKLDLQISVATFNKPEVDKDKEKEE